MAGIKELRLRIKALKNTSKITAAMKMVSAAKLKRAQDAYSRAKPYAERMEETLSRVLAALESPEHPLLEVRDVKRVRYVVVTSDRGLAGAYSSSVIKEAERLVEKLKGEGKDVDLYTSGRKGEAYYKFRQRRVVQAWTGFSDQPTYDVAADIGDTLIAAFLNDDATEADEGTPPGVDEVHVVYTRFRSMLSQEPTAVRLLPLEVVEGTEPPDEGDLLPLYEFEPSASEVLDSLLPRYVQSRIFFALLQAAASELAARQKAMKSATDNAEELIKKYTRIANQARQAGITQEISEIVGGVNALADANAGSE